MIKMYPSGSPNSKAADPGAAKAEVPIWIDLINPNDEERRQARELLGMALPTRDETSAIELSSRLSSSEEALKVNIPSFVRTEGEHGPSTPLGFILTPKILATVRYANSLAFDHVVESMKSASAPVGGPEVFVDLIESIVDVAADRIESIAGDISALSQTVFSEDSGRRGLLRGALFKVGKMQRQINQIRAALMGVSRVLIYLCDAPPHFVSKSLQAQLKSIYADIGSLNEFHQQMSERLQFLLDAVLGFINNDQNDIMRVLTIVSVVTVPPMILAGIWGMNFKSIPEYEWPHGYAFALTMIGVSILLPLIGFKMKKWL